MELLAGVVIDQGSEYNMDDKMLSYVVVTSLSIIVGACDTFVWQALSSLPKSESKKSVTCWT